VFDFWWSLLVLALGSKSLGIFLSLTLLTIAVRPITNHTINSYLKQKVYKKYRVPQRTINLIYLPYNLGVWLWSYL
jgi:hypothetical protein